MTRLGLSKLGGVAARIGRSGGLLASVLGGVSLAQLRTAYPGASVSPVMTNTAVEAPEPTMAAGPS